jgi:regulator of sigma E protease
VASLLTAVFVLSIMIFVHELGHYLAARKAGVGVEKFSLGFGPRVWGVRRGETEYLLSAIPFGGYVKMVGDNPEEEVKDSEKSFLLKSVWARMGIVIAGPASNILSAVVIVYAVYIFGVPAMLAIVGSTTEDFPAAAAGLLEGDAIVAIDGGELSTWDELTNIVHNSAGVERIFSIRRGDELLDFTITPRPSTSENIFGEEVAIGLIGITPSEEFTTVRYGPVESFGMSLQWTYGMAKLTLLGLVKMVQGVVPADNLGGPVMIVQAAGRSADQGFLNLLYFIAYVSVALGLFNLFPIPVLDGGHLFFFAIEAVRGRPLSLRKREILQQVGMVLLISLMLFATKNDIFRIFGW